MLKILQYTGSAKKYPHFLASGSVVPRVVGLPKVLPRSPAFPRPPDLAIFFAGVANSGKAATGTPLRPDGFQESRSGGKFLAAFP
jgi:hypothetical protein